MSRNQAYRLAGEIELQALQNRIGYRGSNVQPSPQSQYGKRGEMVAPLERDIQSAVIQVLNFHPRVAWAVRVNTGAMKVDDRYIKFMFTGASDVWGQMKDGRLLVCETKRKGENPSSEQEAFLKQVASNGGVAFVARSVSDVYQAIPR